jgi:hypothetical protein
MEDRHLRIERRALEYALSHGQFDGEEERLHLLEDRRRVTGMIERINGKLQLVYSRHE